MILCHFIFNSYCHSCRNNKNYDQVDVVKEFCLWQAKKRDPSIILTIGSSTLCCRPINWLISNSTALIILYKSTYLGPSINALWATLSDRRFCKVHSPRHPMRSFTVTFSPIVSSSVILWGLSTLSPRRVNSLASVILTLLKKYYLQ